MFQLGWKKKADTLRMVILSGAHQVAKELPPQLAKTLEMFGDAHKTGDGRGLMEWVQGMSPEEEAERPLWEPAEIYGWKIQATFYLKNSQLWWLLHASYRDGEEPPTKSITFLNKVLDHLGADPTRDMIIGPISSPDGHPPLAFGWWTWFNRSPLFDIQVNKHKDKIRIVPRDAHESDGYVTLNRDDLKR